MKKRPFKRKEYPGKMENLLKNLDIEHSLFKYKTLSSSPHEIYDACSKIVFYETIHEYFLYCENIDKAVVDKVWKEEHLVEGLYQYYLKYEFLNINTWELVEELLCCYAGDVK